MAEYDAGSIFAQVVPSFRGAQQAIGAEAERWGEKIKSTLSDAIAKGVRDGIGDGSRTSGPASTKGGASSGGKFADAFKKRLEASFRSLPDAKITADSSDVDKAIVQIRGALKELSGKRIGIDIDEQEALAQLSMLSGMLEGISKQDPRVSVRADTAAAQAELIAFGAELDKLNDRNVKVKFSDSAFRSAVPAVGALTTAIVGLAPAAVPVLGAVTVAAMGMGAGLAGAGVGMAGLVAVAAPAFSAVGKVTDAQRAATDAAAQYGASSKQAKDALAKYHAELNALPPAQQALAKSMMSAKTVFREWSQSLQPAVLPLFSRGINLLKPVLNAMTPVVKSAATGMGLFLDQVEAFVTAPWFASMAQQFGSLATSVIPTLGGAVLSIIRGFGNLLLAFKPVVGPIVNGISAMANSFVRWSSSLSTSTGFQSFLNYVTTYGPMVMDVIGGIVTAVGHIITAVAPIGAIVLPILRFLIDAFNAIPTWLLTALAVGIMGVVAALTIFNVVMAIFEAVTSPVTLLVGAIVAAIALLAIGIYELVTNWTTVWNWIKTTTLTIVGWLISFLQNAWTTITSAFSTAWNWILSIFRTVWNWIKTTAITAWSGISSFFSGAFAAFTAFFSGIWNGILSVFRTVWNWIKSTATSAWNGISSFFSTAFAAYRALFSAVWNGILSVFRTIWNTLRSVAVTAWNGIRSFFSGAFSAFHSFFTNAWNGIVSAFSSIWGKVKSIASSIWNGVTSVFKSGVNAVLKAVNWVLGKVNSVLKFFSIPQINGGKPLALMATGGIVGLATGGTLTRTVQTQYLASGGAIGGGFKTNGPRAIVGEGRRQHPEYVVPTDPQYRGRAMSLYNALGADLGMPQLASGGVLGWLGGVASSAWNGIKGAAGSVGKWLGDAMNWVGGSVSAIWDKIKGTVTGMIPAGVFRDLGSGAAQKTIKGALDKITSFFSSSGAVGGSPIAYAAGGGVARWAPFILQALAMLHQPATWLGTVERRMNQESGGNPTIGNYWDSNAAKGTPSMGLMQVIGPTFASYAGPLRSRGILDPLANIYAGLNYAIHRYGSLAALNRPGGYDNGGFLPTGYSTVYNGTGKPEPVLAPHQWDAITSGGGAGRGTVIEQLNVPASPGATPEQMSRSIVFALRHAGKGVYA